MAATRRTRPEAAPTDLASKRSAAVTAREAIEAETRAEQTADEDGADLVTLSTRLGSTDVRVPPFDEWTSIARNAINRNDDLTWAQQTLTVAESMQWMKLNPTMKDVNDFFEAWGRAVGQSLGE